MTSMGQGHLENSSFIFLGRRYVKPWQAFVVATQLPVLHSALRLSTCIEAYCMGIALADSATGMALFLRLPYLRRSLKSSGRCKEICSGAGPPLPADPPEPPMPPMPADPPEPPMPPMPQPNAPQG